MTRMGDAKRELAEHPARAFEHILEGLSEFKAAHTDYSRESVLALAAEAILRTLNLHPTGPAADSPLALIDALFSTDLPYASRRFVSVCLLRLLAADEGCFSVATFRGRAFRLFDEVCSDMYSFAKIEIKDQTYQKEAELRSLVAQLDTDLRAIVSSLTSLAVFSGFRQRFKQRLNGIPGRLIVPLFSPPESVGLKLDDVCAAVEDYCRTGDVLKIQGFDNADQALAAYLSEVEPFGTAYSSLLAAVARRLLVLVQEDFTASPFSKPATVRVTASEKKYPLLTAGADVTVTFRVTNSGPGHAFAVTIRATDSTDIDLLESEIYLGHVHPGSVVVTLPGRVRAPSKSAVLELRVTWANYDKSEVQYDALLMFEAQRGDIDWNLLRRQDPYSLEPVTTEQDLVGRDEILNQLIASVSGANVGSSYLFGQKRVGKTSIVQTLKTRLSQMYSGKYFVVYLEGGEYVDPDPKTTIANLGRRVCEELQGAGHGLDMLAIPTFDNALSPLVGFLNGATRLFPSHRILFILDEFDELPVDLYRRGAVGDAFFLTLRSIAGKPGVGFILVGSENMEFILSAQGDALNRFQAQRVDYFSKDAHWADFVDLVRRPVSMWLEISDEALVSLHEQAAGNPYFTKLIAREMFNDAVARRDSHITSHDITRATRLAMQKVAGNSFQHFWEDGIFEQAQFVEDVSLNRRKILVAWAQAKRSAARATRIEIVRNAREFGLTEDYVERELREFERRRVLYSIADGYECVIPFFGAWLCESGVRDIITAFAGPDLTMLRKQEEERALVTADDIVRLTSGWSLYCGRAVTEDAVRAWLAQFPDNRVRRLMFQVLKAVRFYSGANIRAKLSEAHSIVARSIITRLAERKGQRKRGDVIVSYIDGPGKSGAHYARLYADENDIYFENVIERGGLSKSLRETDGLQAIVFVDDFIGSGQSALDHLRAIDKECPELHRDDVQVFFIAIAGFAAGKARLDAEASTLAFKLRTHICDPLGDEDRCFTEKSSAFSDPVMRDEAKAIAVKYGARLLKKYPLGYGDCEATIVFESSCPNNSLPILWAESKDWRPLFPRL